MASLLPGQKDVDKPLPAANLLSFASVTIHGLASNKGHIYNISGSFKRTESFPAPVHMSHSCHSGIDLPTDIWAPVRPPSEGHLELRLGDKFGEGTIGTSYAATVVSSTAPNIPDRVCVKWAKRRNCRPLAREAWFYEQLHKAGNCEGVITPRFYGFFTTSFQDIPSSSSSSSSDDSDSEIPKVKKITIKPWEELRSNDECLLPEDSFEGDICDVNFYDEADLRDNSRWASWRRRRDRLIAILIIEELGSTYPTPTVDSEALDDIREIVTDLGHTGIRHYDLRAPNVMRSLLNGSSPDEGDMASHPSFCRRHQKVHAWRLIDFDRATKTVFSHFTEKDQDDCLSQPALIGNSYFMGTLNPWIYPYEY